MSRLARRLASGCSALWLWPCVVWCALWAWSVGSRVGLACDWERVRDGGLAFTAGGAQLTPTRLVIHGSRDGRAFDDAGALNAYLDDSGGHRRRQLGVRWGGGLPTEALNGPPEPAGFGWASAPASHYDVYGTGVVRWLAVPPWAVLALTLLPPAWRGAMLRRRRRRRRAGQCPACGYDLRASPERCPECGAAVDGEFVLVSRDPP